MLTEFGRRGTRAAAIAIVLVLVLAVTSAPLARVVAPGCRACPTTCPMHRAPRLRCHDTAARATPKPHCHPSSPALAAPGCRHEADPPALSLAPAVLPPRVSCHALPRVDAFVPESVIVNTRTTEPPDTPPPIAS